MTFSSSSPSHAQPKPNSLREADSKFDDFYGQQGPLEFSKMVIASWMSHKLFFDVGERGFLPAMLANSSPSVIHGLLLASSSDIL